MSYTLDITSIKDDATQIKVNNPDTIAALTAYPTVFIRQAKGKNHAYFIVNKSNALTEHLINLAKDVYWSNLQIKSKGATT